MSIVFSKADLSDIDELIQLRLDYLQEDNGSLAAEQIEKISKQLPAYYEKHINADLFIYTARKGQIVACCFLLVSEKPSNPSFLNGKTGTILNVYTKPEYRRKGIARRLIEQLLADAKEMGLDYVEMKATEEGYSLYKSIGFHDCTTKYHNMKMVL